MTQRRIAVCLVVLIGAASLSVSGQQAPKQAPVDRAVLVAQVRAEFLHAWNSYTRLASGHDELNPVSKTPHDWYPPTSGSVATQGVMLYMTAIDALDTMRIMGLKNEATSTSSFLAEHLTFDRDVSVQVFEVTIRVLGALLTEFQATGDKRFLTLADDLGTRMLPAFKSPTGMPYRFVNLKTGQTRDPVSNPAEIGTLMLEFGTLGKLTKKAVFYDTPRKAIVEMYGRRSKVTNLVGENINVETGAWTSPKSHVGGGIDSFYEYLAKADRLFGDAEFGAMARNQIAAVNKYVADDGPDELWYGEADLNTGARTATTYGALHAFFPTVLALTGDLTRARRLQDSNFKMWTMTGIEPEEFDYKTGKVLAAGYQLRPEIAESAYYLFHYTKDPKYLEQGRTIFNDIVKYCRVDDGYTTLRSVVTKEKGDRMHSFLLAETFKYLYLLFAPENTIDFDKTTFNTEAHPLRRTW
jgi:mannosidase alpha-like ER degradation enhancer 2